MRLDRPHRQDGDRLAGRRRRAPPPRSLRRAAARLLCPHAMNHLNIADFFLDARVREGRGDRIALQTDAGRLSYREVQALANRYANVLSSAGVAPEQRVIIALPDGPDYVAALFGILKIGAVVVMVNPELKPDAIEYFFEYSRAAVALVPPTHADAFRAAAGRAAHAPKLLLVGGARLEIAARCRAGRPGANFPTHPDDPAIWLFSGGTTGRPKAAVQPHRSFVNTAECYARARPRLHRGRRDAVGAEALLRLRDGLESLLSLRRRRHQRAVRRALHRRGHLQPDRALPADHPDHRPHHDQSDGESPGAPPVRTSPRCASPPPRARACPRSSTPGGTRPSACRCSTASAPRRVAHLPLQPAWAGSAAARWARWCPGSRSRWRTRRAAKLPDGTIGHLWVRGGSRALGYWQQLDKSQTCFRGEWVVTGDLVQRDADGYYTYGGRADELLKVSGQVALGDGGGGLPAAASGGGAGGGRRRGRCQRPDQAPRLRRGARASRGARRRSSRLSCASGWSRTSVPAR